MLKYLVFIVHITVYLQMVIMSQYVTCEVCNKKFKFVSNTHLKLHNLTTEDYKRMYPNSKFKTDELIYETGKSLRGKTYEDVYGVENANKIKMQRSESTKLQMQNKEQIEVRRRKCGLPEYYTQQRKENMSKGILPEERQMRRIRLIERIEAGKMSTGLQSKTAIKYIKDFLDQRNIEYSKCYFHSNEFNKGGEFMQWINGNIYSYDLVVYDENGNIDIILEVNGPWHYRYDEVTRNPDIKATPFKKDLATIKESYNKDVIKINHALDISNEVYIYWIDNQDLIKINKKMEHYETL